MLYFGTLHGQRIPLFDGVCKKWAEVTRELNTSLNTHLETPSQLFYTKTGSPAQLPLASRQAFPFSGHVKRSRI